MGKQQIVGNTTPLMSIPIKQGYNESPPNDATFQKSNKSNLASYAMPVLVKNRYGNSIKPIGMLAQRHKAPALLSELSGAMGGRVSKKCKNQMYALSPMSISCFQGLNVNNLPNSKKEVSSAKRSLLTGGNASPIGIKRI